MAIPITQNRLVLQGVPQVKFYDGGPRCPEDIPLPSVMRALVEYFGEHEFGCRTCRAIQPGCKIQCSYAYFVGMTGAGSFISWKKGWHGDNVAIFYLDADAATVDRRAFAAAGYGWDYVVKAEGLDNASRFRQQIVKSIQRGAPVIAYGVIGPPEPCLITGYDDGGETLIGWNFFQGMEPQVEQEPYGQFHKRDWLDATECLVIVGQKQTLPPLKERYLDALRFAVKVTRTPIVRPEAEAPEWYRERANGLAAYDAWAEHLLLDADFPEDEAVLRQRHEVHNNMVGHVAEARWYGSVFFIQAAQSDALDYRLVEDLLHAAACYAAEHDLMWKLWDLAGGIDNPDAFRLFAKPDVRRQMIPIIQEARRQDEYAIRHLENALAKPQAK
jgi:hypothetical protein